MDLPKIFAVFGVEFFHISSQPNLLQGRHLSKGGKMFGPVSACFGEVPL